MSLHDSFRSLGANAKTWLADNTPFILYGACCVATLAPAFDMLRNGNLIGAIGAIGVLGSGVGANLLANEMQKWAEDAEPQKKAAAWIALQAPKNADLRTGLDRVLQQTDAIEQIRASMPGDDRTVFDARLRDELTDLGSLGLLAIALKGGAAATGDGATALAAGAIHVDENEGDIRTSPGDSAGGAVAQGTNATALGPGAVHIKKNSGNIDTSGQSKRGG